MRSAPSAASGEERARRSEGSGAELSGQGSRAAERRRSGAEKAAEVRRQPNPGEGERTEPARDTHDGHKREEDGAGRADAAGGAWEMNRPGGAAEYNIRK